MQRYRLSVTVLGLVVCTLGMMWYLWNPDQPPQRMYARLINGRAQRPYITRVLWGTMAGTLGRYLPPSLDDLDPVVLLGEDTNAGLSPTAQTPNTRQTRLRRVAYGVLGWRKGNTRALLAGLLLTWASLVGWFLLWPSWYRAIFPVSLVFGEREPYLAALIALFCLPATWRGGAYPYDFPQLLLCVGLTIAAARQRALPFLLLLAVASVNRETTVLMIAVWWVFNRGKSGPLWASIVVYALIRGAITWAYRGSPGSMLEFHLLDHNLTTMWVRGVGLLPVVALALLPFAIGWRAAPGTVRRALLVTAVPALALGLFSGWLDELRQYSEACNFALAIVALGLFAIRARFGDTRGETVPLLPPSLPEAASSEESG